MRGTKGTQRNTHIYYFEASVTPLHRLDQFRRWLDLLNRRKKQTTLGRCLSKILSQVPPQLRGALLQRGLQHLQILSSGTGNPRSSVSGHRL